MNTVHECPHCRCEPEAIMYRQGTGRINVAAPFFNLVMEISRLDHQDKEPHG